MTEKKSTAKHLYFQTELNKTQIAEVLNISRRTLHYWIREGNWERLKRSSEHMPSIIAENCYHIMEHLTRSYLSERRLTNPVTPKEIDALHKLILTINKLKARTALNENVETFALFVDKLRQRAPEVAEKVAPFVEEYLEERASITAGDCAPAHFNQMGYIPMNDTTDYEEQRRDNKDFLAWDTDGLIPELQDSNTLIPQPVIIPDDQHCATSEQDLRNTSTTPETQTVENEDNKYKIEASENIVAHSTHQTPQSAMHSASLALRSAPDALRFRTPHSIITSRSPTSGLAVQQERIHTN